MLPRFNTVPAADTNTLCHRYLHQLYQSVLTQQHVNRKITDVSETYGEILYPSIAKLFSLFPPSEHDVFYDLGSGLGKVVIQVFLDSLVKQACGIEIVPEFFQIAQTMAAQVQHELPLFYQDDRKLSFQLGSFLELPLDTATMVLISSPCFTQALLNPLGQRINQLPGIHTVMSLRPLPTLTRLRFKQTARIEGSWDTALCFVYRAE